MNVDLVQLSQLINTNMNISDISIIIHNLEAKENKKPPDKNICEYCKGDIIEEAGCRICCSCGNVEGFGLTNEKSTIEEQINSYYITNKKYSRIVHLIRIIKRMNCTSKSTKDNFDIKSVIDKYKINQSDNIDTVKSKLKNYHYNHYIIMKYLNNGKYIFIDYDLQKRIIKTYVKAVSIYFSKLKPQNRKNIMNNYFIIKKILSLIGREDISNKIHNLRVEKNIIKYEKIWERIERYL
jgi:hypothetical protein